MYPSYLIHFNPNHDPKSGRFTFSKGEIKKFRKLEKNKINANFYSAVTSNDKIKNFNENSKEYQEVRSAKINKRSVTQKIALKADEIAVKKLLTDVEKDMYDNGDFFEKERMIARIMGDPSKREEYYNIVRDVVKNDPSLLKMSNDAEKRLTEAYESYKKAGKEFVDKALGSYADLETENPIRVMGGRQQTLSESIVNQMFIDAMLRG